MCKQRLAALIKKCVTNIRYDAITNTSQIAIEQSNTFTGEIIDGRVSTTIVITFSIVPKIHQTNFIS